MRTLAAHWPEYAIEAFCLALFMASAVTFAILFQHPASPLVAVTTTLPGMVTRIPIGVAMGLTAAALIYSPFGRRSGAHMNPSVTLAFYRLGRIGGIDALGYVAAHFAGGIAGVAITAWLFSSLPAHPSVNYVATVPGPSGVMAAFAAEAGISAVLMIVVLAASTSNRLSQWTGVAASMLVAAFIVFEAPLSGMSMNPARTLGSAAFAHGAAWRDLWVYFTAPPLGMLLSAEIFVRLGGRARCAKLHHGWPGHGGGLCIFHCDHMSHIAPVALRLDEETTA